MEKKEEKEPEDIKKEEKDENELKSGPENRSRVTKSGDESVLCWQDGKRWQGWRVGMWSEGPVSALCWAELCTGGTESTRAWVMKGLKGVSLRCQRSRAFLVKVCVYRWLSDLGICFSWVFGRIKCGICKSQMSWAPVTNSRRFCSSVTKLFLHLC